MRAYTTTPLLHWSWDHPLASGAMRQAGTFPWSAVVAKENGGCLDGDLGDLYT